MLSVDHVWMWNREYQISATTREHRNVEEKIRCIKMFSRKVLCCKRAMKLMKIYCADYDLWTFLMLCRSLFLFLPFFKLEFHSTSSSSSSLSARSIWNSLSVSICLVCVYMHVQPLLVFSFDNFFNAFKTSLTCRMLSNIHHPIHLWALTQQQQRRATLARRRDWLRRLRSRQSEAARRQQPQRKRKKIRTSLRSKFCRRDEGKIE